MGAKLYNVLENPTLQFAILHRLGRGEYAVRVKGVGKRKVDDLGKVAGDHTFGFPSRHKRDEEVRIVPDLDGGLKKSRFTTTHPRKMPCRLPTTFEVTRASMDPLVRAEKDKRDKKIVRAGKRNRGARYGRRSAREAVSVGSNGKGGGLERTCGQ